MTPDLAALDSNDISDSEDSQLRDDGDDPTLAGKTDLDVPMGMPVTPPAAQASATSQLTPDLLTYFEMRRLVESLDPPSMPMSELKPIVARVNANTPQRVSLTSYEDAEADSTEEATSKPVEREVRWSFASMMLALSLIVECVPVVMAITVCMMPAEVSDASLYVAQLPRQELLGFFLALLVIICCMQVVADAGVLRLEEGTLATCARRVWQVAAGGARVMQAFRATSTVFLLILVLSELAPTDEALATGRSLRRVNSAFHVASRLLRAQPHQVYAPHAAHQQRFSRGFSILRRDK
ncbi:MAG: hypothetical protein SGPRY_003864 [Prymnesium sp.]